MNSVRILEDTVVNQIAAGEVVERPSSVVKELVENALDAGADEITVSIINGGKSGIEVLDNGKGMSRSDAMLAIERFGTSKIQNIDDLFNVSTLGFRGEALPSIASVSRFTLHTSSDGSSGTRIKIAGGAIRDVVESESPKGTRIGVRNLFFNVPARRKFLKGEGTETGLIKALLSDFAVSHTAVRFSLIVDGRESKVYPKSKDFFERVTQIGDFDSNCIRITEDYSKSWGELSIRGVLSHPVGALSSAGKLRIIINGRSVREKLVLGAVRDGFGNFLKSGKYPAGVLKIDIEPSQLDVNVHPQKSEVRFREGGAVFSLISKAIREEFNRSNPGSLIGAEARGTGEHLEFAPRAQATSIQFGIEASTTSALKEANARPELVRNMDLDSVEHSRNEQIYPLERGQSASVVARDSQQTETRADEDSRSELSGARYLGQILGLYLLFEDSRGLHIVDMHAAHERVRFYKIKKQFLESRVATQRMLLPETLELPPEKMELFASIRKQLSSLGIDCEQFDNDTVIIRSSPAILKNVNVKELLEQVLELPEWGRAASPLESKIDAAISSLACHSSIRRGRELEREEVYQLLEDLHLSQLSAFCPHGRPVITSISESQLEALFGRTGF